MALPPPNWASAMPNRQEKNSTASSVFSANAPTTLSGMMPSRNSFVVGRCPPPVLASTADASSVAGSTLKPAPGLTRLPTASPKTSANVVTTSK